MRLLKETFKKIVLIIVLVSILITFLATPAAYAKLDLEDGEFYYSGTTKGSYVPTTNIFSWLINALAQVADFILGMLSMIVRAPFVGWTALLEKMLTWALESTMGVSADGSIVGTSVNKNGEVEINTSNLTGLTDSSNNVTVEAIVYNRVAALDIDVFDVEFDRTISGTGQKLVCTHCQKQDVASGSGLAPYISKPVNECITDDKIEQIKSDAAVLQAGGTKNKKLDTEKYCSTNCDCEGCDACEFYVAQLLQEEPIIYKLKMLVATWYTIIRYLAIAAMLIVLIGVGLKMALSTIASDKAVYKRMLVDWCVGFIILFAIHYFMIFVINVNEILVNTIAKSASEVTKVQMIDLGEDVAEYTDSDLELKIYEEVRTRAYDAKLSNGMIGMVMYMTLVFLAFKYVVIYLKRFLTIVVLTLMAPAIGVAYALQKVLSGKSAALKTWMTEYIMNVIIQTVHALIYSIFISQALIMSLQSIAGMILALILMNYTSKADELFKKIFKFGGGDSLLGHTEGAADSFKQNMDAMLGFAAGAKPLAKAVANSPYGKVVLGAGKALVAGGVALTGVGYNFVKNNIKSDEYYREREIDAEMDANFGGSAFKRDRFGRDAETEEDYEKRRAAAAAVVDARYERETEGKAKEEELDKKLLEKGGPQIESEAQIAAAKLKAEGDRPTKETQEEALNAKRNQNRFRKLQTPTTGSIVKAHFERLISMEDVFKTGRPTGTNKFKVAMKTAWIAALGSSHYDKKKGKWVNDKNSVFDQLSASQLLGLTDQDKNMLKDIGGDMIHGLVGMGSLFVGMGTIVANPKVGMALLGKGISSTNKVFGRDTDISRAPAKYKFGRFSAESIDSIRQVAIEKAKNECDELLVADIKKRYPELAENLKNGIASGVTVGTLGIGGALTMASGGLVAATAAVPFAGAVAGATMFTTRLTRNSKIVGKVADLNKHYASQQKKLIDKFNNEADKEELNSIKASTEYREKCFDKRLEREALEEAEYDEENSTIKVEPPKVKETDIQITDKLKDKGVKAENVAKTLDQELDRIILNMTAKGSIDVTSKAVQSDIIKQLGLSMENKKIIENAAEVQELFVGGEAELTRKLKLKAVMRNKAVEEADKKLKETLSKEQAEEVQSIIQTITQDTTERGKGLSEITVDDVVSKMKTKTKDGSQTVDSGDGSRTATDPDKKTTKVDSATQDAIKEYLKMLQDTSAIGKVQLEGEIVKAAVEEVKGNAKEKGNKTKEKLKQVLKKAFAEEQNLDGEKPENPVIGENGKLDTNRVIELLGAEKSDAAVLYAEDTLKNLLKIKELNQKALKREPEVPNGNSKKYTETVRDNKTEYINIAQERKKLLGYEIEQISGGNSTRSPSEIISDIENSKANIRKMEENINKRNNRLQYSGPIQDIDAYIEYTLFKKK